MKMLLHGARLLGVAVIFGLFIVNSGYADIDQRIAPVGRVRVAADKTAEMAKKEPVAAVKVSARSAKEIYDSKCVICHAAGVAGAPKFQDNGSWKARLKGGWKDLLHKSKQGLNAMPPKGTCTDCSDKELLAAIQYMLPKEALKALGPTKNIGK